MRLAHHLAPDIGSAILKSLAHTQPELVTASIEACPVNITIASTTAPDMPLIYVNPSFTETTGYAAEDVIGHNCRFLQGPETEPEAVATIRAAIAAEESAEVEFTNYRKDGTPFINALKLVPVRDAMGNLTAFVGVQNDVTTERMRQRNEIERQRLEALGQSAGGVAHQLNNLLQPILTLVALHRPDITDKAIGDDLDLVLTSARQAADFVDDALAFSRQGSRRTERIAIDTSVRDNVQFLKTLLPAKVAVMLVVDDAAAGAAADIDPTQFSQVLANLMMNAAQAMKGDGRIEISVTRPDAQHIAVNIADTGPGIPPELVKRVFEPFFTTRADDGGSGLGLSVVYGIIKAFGGTIEVAENAGDNLGCRVTVVLPMA